MSLDIYLEEEGREVFDANITHNLGGMAGEAGLYDCLWRAPENGFMVARQLIEPLETGVAMMKGEPARFVPFNPKNGWGSYAVFVPWLEELLEACRKHPEAEIRTSR